MGSLLKTPEKNAFCEIVLPLSPSVYRRFRRAIDCSDSDNGVSRKLAPANRRPRPPAKFRARPRTLFLGCSSLGWSSTVAPYKIPILRLNAPAARCALIAPHEPASRQAPPGSHFAGFFMFLGQVDHLGHIRRGCAAYY